MSILTEFHEWRKALSEGLLARQGDKIKDDHGKHIATVTQDIHHGEDPLHHDNFKMADGSKPQRGETAHPAIRKHFNRD